MKNLKNLWLIVTFLTLLSAEDVMIVTVDERGKGIIERLKNLSPSDLSSVYGLPDNPPEGTTALVLEPGKKARWTNANQKELEKRYEAKTYEDKTKKFPKEKDKERELPSPDVPKEIFDGIVFEEIEPLNGVWKSVFDSTNMSGCSDMMQSMIKNFTPPTSTMNLKFSKPFNPNKDLMSGQFKWKKLKVNQWKGTMYQSGPIPQGMSFTGDMLLGVVSEKKMSIRLTQKIVLPKEMAQLTGSSTDCTVVTKGHYIKIK